MPHKSTSVPRYEAPKPTNPQSNRRTTTTTTKNKHVKQKNPNKTDTHRKEEVAVMGEGLQGQVGSYFRDYTRTHL
jgi:hypothetical protein